MNLNHIAKKPFFDLFYRSPCMALMLRASFHDAGTFCTSSKTGGPRGTLRFQSELAKAEHNGLDFAIDQIEEIKHDGNHITALLSYADLIQLGGYAAVEYCGGPSMIFKMGREDASESEVVPSSRLPDPHESQETMLQKMLNMGFTQREFVALMGSHTIGFAHMGRSGFQGRWTQNPHVFDNTYYKEVLLGERSKYLKTGGELLLARDPEMRAVCQAFADDERLFFAEYAQAHVKMSELGWEGKLLSEFDEPATKAQGGYIEPI